jgi:D-3-phosphoglycerate dehydrogenase / 2-oxoglutarate reductase
VLLNNLPHLSIGVRECFPPGPGADMLEETAVTRTTGWRQASPRPRALVLAPFRGPAVPRLAQIADVVHDSWLDHRPPRVDQPADLAARLASERADILITEADPVNGPVLEQHLAIIGVTRGDPVNVDLPAATERGIPVLCTPGRNAGAVAELVVAVLFAVARHVLVADREVRTGTVYDGGQLPQVRHRAWELAGRTAGLVGLGAVGQAVRWRLEGLGMRVIACDPRVSGATHTLRELLSESDVVSMHAPASAETARMIGAREFAAMRKGAIYLNTARAGLHDVDALVSALRSGQLAGAGLDHFDGEWLDPGHPLTALPNVVLTPHIGGATYDTEVNHSTMIVSDIERLLHGERPLHCANPEVLG